MGEAAMNTELVWIGGDRFEGTVGQAPCLLDGDSAGDLSPMQAVAAGLAGCMSIDVRMILDRGRVKFTGLRAHLEAERAADPPRRFTGFRLHFVVAGQEVSTEKVARAIELSCAKYCSVWHSLNQEAELETSFEVVEADAS